MFGYIPGIRIGSTFPDRKSLLDAGLHRQNQAGIAGTEKLGAESIVISGGYEDDIDDGDVVVYTGHGGRDPNTGKQVTDQELTRGNLALAKNVTSGLPVRVVRAAPGGYRYDGLYRVERYWPERGKSGHIVYRYRLVREDLTVPDDLVGAASGPTQKKEYTMSRIVRDTQTARAVKAIHKHKCQVCGVQLLSPAGAYSEAAHIRPLGKPHNGPDSADNILCLCPNHHVLFDLFGFSIAADLSLIGIKESLITHPKHRLSQAHIAVGDGAQIAETVSSSVARGSVAPGVLRKYSVPRGLQHFQRARDSPLTMLRADRQSSNVSCFWITADYVLQVYRPGNDRGRMLTINQVVYK